MKTRNGFVSNSSTSSFCIYGAMVDRNKVNEEEMEKWGLEVYYGDSNWEQDKIYVGKSWSSIKDDETGAQFKKQIESLLKRLFDIDKCSTIEKAWYDG